MPTPAVRSFCQCEILLIATHLQWGGACGDSVLARGSECHLSPPHMTFYCRRPQVELFPHLYEGFDNYWKKKKKKNRGFYNFEAQFQNHPCDDLTSYNGEN